MLLEEEKSNSQRLQDQVSRQGEGGKEGGRKGSGQQQEEGKEERRMKKKKERETTHTHMLHSLGGGDKV